MPHTLNGERFLQFLQNEFTSALEELPLRYRRHMWLRLDGAPAHFARNVRRFLERHPRWVGRGGPVTWPPRSPDLTPLDFFLWGHMKQQVYFDTVNTRDELIARIEYTAHAIRQDPRMLRKATKQVAVRSTMCLIRGGGHFEQFM
ncbi:unnamed protein product [Colias eurytheme]|nr:unnamed protein product [Colias eurytheme]